MLRRAHGRHRTGPARLVLTPARAEQHRPRFGAGIVMWRNAEMLALEVIGVAQSVQDNRVKPDYYETFLNGTSVSLEVPGFPYWAITRPKLHALLADAARAAGVEIVTSSRAVGADPAGALLMADGSPAGGRPGDRHRRGRVGRAQLAQRPHPGAQEVLRRRMPGADPRPEEFRASAGTGSSTGGRSSRTRCACCITR